MVHPNKKQKVKKTSTTTCKEDLIFNSDILPKIMSYLPSFDVLNLAITCKRFGISDNDKTSSLIEKCASIVIQDFATDELLGALPHYDGEGSLADYHYLQLLKAPLTFDQLVGGAVYMISIENEGDKSCVTTNVPGNSTTGYWGIALSNNILRAGKHYVTFDLTMGNEGTFWLGVMRPGQANQNARGAPIFPEFFHNFSRYMVHGEDNNDVQCCMYNIYSGFCHFGDWGDSNHSESRRDWEGMETMRSDCEIGMILDLDEGTLSAYKNGRFLGVMKRGLAGPYCWVASIYKGEVGKSSRVTIKRGSIPLLTAREE